MRLEPVPRVSPSGLVEDVSSQRLAKSRGGFSSNSFPRLTITNLVAAKTTWAEKDDISHRITRQTGQADVIKEKLKRLH